ncbi:MAG: hypothetical protein LBF88_14125 [Planctomycetaceae bacterium]|nr:hypothetical protein [Planctomycetaceae bacterium]
MFRLKHRVGGSRLAPVFGRQWVLPTVWLSNFSCRTQRQNRLSPTRSL